MAEGNGYETGFAAYQKQEFGQAEAIWSRLAEEGDANAQYALAVMHLKGEAEHPDPALAFELMEKAARQGHATAMFNVGVALWGGSGTRQDRQQALEWWRKAAAKGEVGAQYNLGLVYYIGKEQPRDLGEAIRWLSAAAAAKHPEAEKLLGLIEKEKSGNAGRDGSEGAGREIAALDAPAPPLSMERAPIEDANTAHSPETAPPAEEMQEYWRIAAETTLHPTSALKAPVMATLPAGTPVEVLERKKGRARITVPGGIAVWVYGKYVSSDGDRGEIRGTTVNARPIPDTDNAKAPPVGRFKKGDRVTILEREGKWTRVRAPARLGAWIDEAALEPYSDTPANRKSAWETAGSR